MDDYRVIGHRRLFGEIQVQGSKNAVLPILSATILTGKKTMISNCPRISDVENAIQILRDLGAKVTWEKNILIVDTKSIESYKIDASKTEKMRSSICFLGALAGRFHRASIYEPGGCRIGKRPIDMHLAGLRALGCRIEEEEGCIHLECDRIKGGSVTLPYPSVGATENLMMAAIFAEGPVRIENAAREPEIILLAQFLEIMGGRVIGAGSRRMTIYPTDGRSKEICIRIPGDRIVAGTYLAMTAGCGGNLLLKGILPDELKEVLTILKKMGCIIKLENHSIRIIRKEGQTLLSPKRIITRPYPGFPTDLQSLFLVLCTCAQGKTKIEETVFSNRCEAAKELWKMGAKIDLYGSQHFQVNPSELKAATVKAKDLRGGAALIFAAMLAKGETKVVDSGYIKRGYEDLAFDVNHMGGCIQYNKGR